MARYGAVLPPEDTASPFKEQLRPALDRLIAGMHKSRTFTLRNMQLPKLIHGGLRVRDAECFVEEAP